MRANKLAKQAAAPAPASAPDPAPAPAPNPNPDFIVDKPPVEEATGFKAHLHKAQNAGISKRKKRNGQSRQQKLRQQKGVENAERNIDKLEVKIKKSTSRQRRRQRRARGWDELNGKTVTVEGNGEKMAEVEEDADGKAKDMEGVEMPDLEQQIPVLASEPVAAAETEPEVALDAEPEAMPEMKPEAVSLPTSNGVDDLDDVA